MALKSLLFVSLLTLISLFADTSLIDAEFRGEAKAKITFLEKQNVELKTKLDSLEDKQKSVEEYKAIIDRQDKRVEDVNAKMASVSEKTSWLAIIVGLWAIVATFISIGLPLYLTFRWKKEVSEEAKETAKMEINELKAEFEVTVQEAKDELHKLTETHNYYIKEKELMKGKDISEYSKTNGGDREGLKGAFQYALYQAEIKNDYSNWFDVAMLALKIKDEKAIDYWDNAINIATDDLSKSLAIMNKGSTFGILKKYDKVIETYDYLIDNFGHNQNEKIQVFVANALLGKGISQEQLPESKQKAIETYDHLLNKFNHTSNEKINEAIAQALLHKGMLQVDVFKSIEDASKTYKKLIKKFENCKNEKIIKQIASACLNLCELQLIENKPFDNQILCVINYINDHKQEKLKFKMLETVKSALKEEQPHNIEQLKQEFSDANLENWSWKELDTWAEKLEDEEVKKRVQQTIEVFKNWNKKE